MRKDDGRLVQGGHRAMQQAGLVPTYLWTDRIHGAVICSTDDDWTAKRVIILPFGSATISQVVGSRSSESEERHNNNSNNDDYNNNNAILSICFNCYLKH